MVLLKCIPSACSWSWYGNDSDPLELGWEMRAGNLLPIDSDRAASHERLLKLIYCDCQSGCKENSACQCRNAKEACNAMCGHCVGLTCTNAFDIDMVQINIALIRQVTGPFTLRCSTYLMQKPV